MAALDRFHCIIQVLHVYSTNHYQGQIQDLLISGVVH